MGCAADDLLWLLKFMNKYLMLTKNQVSGQQQQYRCGW
jgi:hypothetical protein